MRKLNFILFLLINTLSHLNSQTTDFQLIGGQIIPILGKDYAQYKGFKYSGILLRESQWIEVKSRQSLDLLVFFRDKNQYFFVKYTSPYLKNQSFEIGYNKNLNSILMLGIELGNRRQMFIDDIPVNSLKLAINTFVNVNPNHQLFIKAEKEIAFKNGIVNNGFIVGIDNKINSSLQLKLYFAYNMEFITRGLRGNIKGNFKLFEGELGWEPLPYSLSFGMAYKLPKNCKFGINLRNHQWLGLLTSVFFQKQWIFKT